MRRFVKRMSVACAVFVCLLTARQYLAEDKPATPLWSFNATNIEACSCAMPCPCHWVGVPTHTSHDEMGHAGYCRFNNAMRVNKGHWGDTTLDGVIYWISGDLGDEFATGQAKWLVFTFEPGTTPEQREAIKQITRTIFMGDALKWESITEGPDAKIDFEASSNTGSAMLDGGKAGEIVLKKSEGMDGEPIVLQNMKYMAVPRNDGWIMTGTERQGYHLGDNAFETHDSNGMIVTIDMNSDDFAEE